MLSQPGRAPVVAVCRVLVKDNHHGPDLARDPLVLPNVQLPLVPVPQSLADVDAVQQRGLEDFHPAPFRRQNAFPLFLEKCPVVFQDQVLGRVGTDSGPVELTRPLTRNRFLSATPQAIRSHPRLASGKPAPELDSPHVGVELFSRDPDGHEIRLDPLVRTAAGQFPSIPGVVVVHHRSGCDRKVKEPRNQLPVQKCQVSSVASQQASLPVRHLFAGGGSVSPFRFGQKPEDHALAVNAPDACDSCIVLGSIRADRRLPPGHPPGRSFHDGLQGLQGFLRR